MNISLRDIVCLHALGQDESNEDSVFPEAQQISVCDRLFMVCEGVGGRPGGEIASQLVCQHFTHYILQLGEVFQSKGVLKEALCFVEQCLDEYIRVKPAYKGMASTLAYLCLNNYGAVLAWVGDSRIVQIREGRIIQQTKDHSLVNALLDYGEISQQTAATHPKRKVLLQSVSGTDTPAKLDILYVDDILPGDYFMVCSAAIMEGLAQHFPAVFVEKRSLEELKYKIDSLCSRNSVRNYTMILLEIGPVDYYEKAYLPVDEEVVQQSARVDGPDEKPKRKGVVPIVVPGLAILFLVVFLWLSIPVSLQLRLVGETGVFIRDADHRLLINAFPLSDKVEEHNRLASIREKMLIGGKPYDQVDLFLVSHWPAVENDSIRYFMQRFLQRNQKVPLYPPGFMEQLGRGPQLFPFLKWNLKEAKNGTNPLVVYLPTEAERKKDSNIDFTAFLVHMKRRNILYAGDPELDVSYLASIPQPIDYLLISDWSLRTAVARQIVKDRFEDRMIIVLPSQRPMNGQQRLDIRHAFPDARYLEKNRNRLNLR